MWYGYQPLRYTLPCLWPQDEEMTVAASPKSVPSLVTHLSGVSLKSQQDIIKELTGVCGGGGGGR